MTLDLTLKVINLLVIISSVGFNVLIYFKTKQDKRLAQLATDALELAERLRNETADRKSVHGELDKRLSVMEERVKAMPTHDDIEEIRAALSELGNNVAAVNERSGSTHDAVRRIEKHLLDRAR